MCGLCGKINFDRDEPVSAAVVGKMMRVMSHRGPDGAGRFVAGPVGLGHRRLSIIDLSTGDQPMSNEDGTVWVVFNGEIYNFAELRRELVARGHCFKSSSDTEVIVHMYEEARRPVRQPSSRHVRICVVGSTPAAAAACSGSAWNKADVLHQHGPFAGLRVRNQVCHCRSVGAARDRPYDRRPLFYLLLCPGDLTLLRGIRKLDPGQRS